MRHFDPALLADVRLQPCCWCSRRAPSEAAHIYAKGMGNSRQIDLPWNVVPLCRECHQSSHDGQLPLTFDLLAIAAQRTGLFQAEIENLYARMMKADKTCVVCPDCGGNGLFDETGPGSTFDCGRCNGAGILTQSGEPWRE